MDTAHPEEAALAPPEEVAGGLARPAEAGEAGHPWDHLAEVALHLALPVEDGSRVEEDPLSDRPEEAEEALRSVRQEADLAPKASSDRLPST